MSADERGGRPCALNADTFGAAIESASVVVWWWAASCGPSHAFGSIYAAAAARHRDILFATVEVEQEPLLSRAAGIGEIPTVMAFHRGALLFRCTGFLVDESLDALARRLRKAAARSLLRVADARPATLS